MPKKLIAGINDFATVCPDLAAEFVRDLKGNLTPNQFFPGSDIKGLWRCSKCGHEWTAWVSDRRKGSSPCPVCKKLNREVPNSLRKVAPLLSEEWDAELNGDLTPDMVPAGSHDSAWWKCNICGKSYSARIGNRVYCNTGCPNCNKEKRTSFPEQAILYYMSKLQFGAIGRYTSKWFSKWNKKASPEIDVYIPTLGVGIEYDGHAFHADAKRDLEKSVLCDSLGITLYRVREEECPDLGIKSDLIQTVKVRDDQTLETAITNILRSIEKTFGVKCDVSVDLERDKQEIYSMMDCSIKEASLAETNPRLAMFWDYERNGITTPDKVMPKSGKEFYWICETCGTSFKSPVHRRSNAKWCKCSHCGHSAGATKRWAPKKNLEEIAYAS